MTVFDVNESAMINVAGVNAAPSPAEVAKDVEVVVSMLPSNQHVQDVYGGDNGVLT